MNKNLSSSFKFIFKVNLYKHIQTYLIVDKMSVDEMRLDELGL